MRTLVLNASYEPLAVVPTPRAVVLVLMEKAVVEESSDDRTINSKNFSMPAPLVVRLNRYVNIPYQKRKLPVTNRNVVARDDFTCCYCGGYGDTVDHIVPRALGGENVWTNVVTACKKCNGKKGHKTLEQLGWKLDFEPYEPTNHDSFVVSMAASEECWQPYLSGD